MIANHSSDWFHQAVTAACNGTISYAERECDELSGQNTEEETIFAAGDVKLLKDHSPLLRRTAHGFITEFERQAIQHIPDLNKNPPADLERQSLPGHFRAAICIRTLMKHGMSQEMAEHAVGTIVRESIKSFKKFYSGGEYEPSVEHAMEKIHHLAGLKSINDESIPRTK